MVFSNSINLSGLPYDLLDMMDAMDMGLFGVILLVCAICILLGMIFEAVGVLLLIVPLLLPTLQVMGVDMIWAGIIMVSWWKWA